MRGGYVVLAPDAAEQFEDLRVVHVPGADLLLDHVETGLVDRAGMGDRRIQGEGHRGVLGRVGREARDFKVTGRRAYQSSPSGL